MLTSSKIARTELNFDESFPSISELNSVYFSGERQKATPATSFESLSIAIIERPHSIALLANGTPNSLYSSKVNPASLVRHSYFTNYSHINWVAYSSCSHVNYFKWNF